jgi:hypothetical protein
MKIFGNNTDMKLLAAVVLGVLFFGCAYDPMMDEGDSKSEFHADDLERGIDLVVNSSLVLNGAPEKIARLIFLQDAVLSTDGADLKIVADEIISHSGTISTLPLSHAPEAGADGRSGGTLHIEARKGRGHLTVLAQGQDGNTGEKGSTGTRGPKGPSGQSGVSGRRTVCPFSVGASLFFDGPSPIDRCHWESYCKRQTGDGARGGQGTSGGRGGRGGSGGDSAKVLVKIKDASQLTITTESYVGRGGAGGSGGDGGRGGAGGNAGSQDRSKVCRKASAGPEGQRGPTGEQGQAGRDGERKPICLVLGSARIGDCDDEKTKFYEER